MGEILWERERLNNQFHVVFLGLDGKFYILKIGS